MQAQRFVCAVAAAGAVVLGAAPAASAVPGGRSPVAVQPPAARPGSIVTVYDESDQGSIRVVRVPRGGVRTGLGGSVRTGNTLEVAAGAALLVGAAGGAGLIVYRRLRSSGAV